ncbi:protein phosphatase 1 regulatory subunit 21 [Euwallacea similis]|uniref:protein phosphatase 1 regulatory subunit 21 n=1 Tax=Euwallacea similis TaxID=1736056 RepID=UPI00344C9698
MENPSDLDAKYQKLAAEYSKVRSHASVLKKAVLDEQARNSELKDVVKSHEQTIRKHDQEMESLIFRNEQLTKRISVLQQELQVNSHGKRGKAKPVESSMDFGVLDEEFQKKILENAQLLSSISDKELEIGSYRERIEWLEGKICNLEREVGNRDEIGRVRLDKAMKENEMLCSKIKELTCDNDHRRNTLNDQNIQISHWKSEAEKLRLECNLLQSKPTSNCQLTEYYESQLSDMLESKNLALAETKSLLAENQALKLRLENVTLELTELQHRFDKSQEELLTTSSSYRGQLDAMTEHLAAQNEKITQQCDEIQILRHKLSAKK